MQQKPFLKWAGGKRWLADAADLEWPAYSGRYIEPFLGGGAIFFALAPASAILSDANERLIDAYCAIRDDWRTIKRLLGKHHKHHSRDYYYAERSRIGGTPAARAARFVYLNRACWNGLYRVNRRGEFNVPIGTKDWVLSDSDDFQGISAALQVAELHACDFEESIDQAVKGDLIFADPPYTVAHNFNGFVKYNETMFSWSDQLRLAAALRRASARGAFIITTNADHSSVRELYNGFGTLRSIERSSIISGKAEGRQITSELLISA